MFIQEIVMGLGLRLGFGLALLTLAHSASAATITTTVDGKAGAWDHTANPTLVYSNDSGAPTVVNDPTLSFAPGGAFTISYLSGDTQTASFYGKTDGSGYSNIVADDVAYPAQYASNTPAYLQELIGAFATSAGVVVGTPFVIGNSGTFFAPTGASELLLGINDDYYSDNLGVLTVSVTGPTAVSAVPLPASLPMFGAGILGLAGIGYGMKRNRKAAA